jgi:hypothetical protein
MKRQRGAIGLAKNRKPQIAQIFAIFMRYLAATEPGQ